MIVYVCSPFAGDIEGNRVKAIGYCREVIKRGHTPIAPHLLYPQMLDENVPDERELGLAMGIKLLDRCDEVWVHGDRISRGMADEISRAIGIGKPTRIMHGTVSE